MLSADDIQKAKKTTKYTDTAHHEHDDCIRIAYEWLDAQRKIKTHTKTLRPIKHIIEKWAGRYISQSDVDVAAHLHKEISGRYPHFNINSKLIEPDLSRIDNLSQFNTQKGYRDDHDAKVYSLKELPRRPR